MSEAQDTLRDIVFGGLGPDIFVAERARELHRAIGEAAGAVNSAGYGELFSTVQNAAVGELTMTVAKLFERANPRYPVRSIPSAIALLRGSADSLTAIQPESAIGDFARASDIFHELDGLEGPSFNLKLADLLEASCPDPRKADACDLSRTLDALRTSRDKAIAHNEALDRTTLPRAKWSEAETLFAYAKAVTGGLAMAYFASAYVADSGYYVRSADAQIAANQLRRLLKTANVFAATI